MELPRPSTMERPRPPPPSTREQSILRHPGAYGIWGHGAYRPIQAPRLFLCPQKPLIPPEITIEGQGRERKPDDFWGILGHLSGSVAVLKEGTGSGQSSTPSIRRGRLISALSINFTATPNSSPLDNPNRAHAQLQKIRELWGILGHLSGAIDRAE